MCLLTSSLSGIRSTPVMPPSTTSPHVRKLCHFFCVASLESDVFASAPGSDARVTRKCEASVAAVTVKSPL